MTLRTRGPLTLLACALFLLNGGKAQANNFVHQSHSTNTVGNLSSLPNAYTGSDPSTVVLVSHQFSPAYPASPGSATRAYLGAATGVWFNASNSTWNVFQQNGGNLPAAGGFNIHTFQPGSDAFMLTGQVFSNQLVLDHASLNANPNAVLTVTPVYSNSTRIYFDKHYGVFYNTQLAKWTVFTQDRTAIAPNTLFAVHVEVLSNQALVHTATAANNVAGFMTRLDAAGLNQNPYARPIVTQRFNPETKCYNNHPIGVWYDTNSGFWYIYNEDITALAVGCQFNVSAPTPVYQQYRVRLSSPPRCSTLSDSCYASFGVEPYPGTPAVAPGTLTGLCTITDAAGGVTQRTERPYSGSTGSFLVRLPSRIVGRSAYSCAIMGPGGPGEPAEVQVAGVADSVYVTRYP